MKKILSSFLILTTLLNLFVIVTSAENVTPSVSANDFFMQVQEFADKHEPGALSGGDITSLPLNRIIVKTQTNTPLEEDYGAIDVLEGYDGIHILQYRSETDTENAYINFFMDENITFVDYDSWVCLNGSIGKCYCNSPMGLTECGCLSTEKKNIFCTCEDPDSGTHYSWNSIATDVDKAYEYLDRIGTEYQDVTVAILDTGLFVEHEKFKDSGRIVVDDNFKVLINKTYWPSDIDLQFHGTHVAGIVFDNTKSNVKICPYRIFGEDTNSLEYSVLCTALIAAIENNVDVINMSIYIKPYDAYILVDENGNLIEKTDYEEGAVDAQQFMNEVLEKAIDNNIVLVVAAGNFKKDAALYSPASFEDAIVVAATTRYNKPDSTYSNKGSCVDIAAPGTDIYSTVPWVPSNTDQEIPAPESLKMRVTGTSQAAPLVSAAAALLKSINPDITPAEVERIIKETAYVPEGWDTDYGEGIINFYNMAVAAVSEKPEIKITSDGKIEIISPEGSDSKIYYSLDGTVPTIENKLVYTEPLKFSELNSSKIIAVCHESGKLISEPTTYILKPHFYISLERFQTDCPLSGGENMNITWRSFDPDIAKVDQNGNITGVSVGETQVYATFDSGLRITYVVTVEPPWWQQLLRLLFFGFIWYRT